MRNLFRYLMIASVVINIIPFLLVFIFAKDGVGPYSEADGGGVFLFLYLYTLPIGGILLLVGVVGTIFLNLKKKFS